MFYRKHTGVRDHDFTAHGLGTDVTGWDGTLAAAERRLRQAAKRILAGDASPGRHCRSTLSLTVIGCHSFRIHTLILLPLLSFL
jgi:hypothetical protein